jgi:pimeloyl-ACP methyl ester carboxylesterase
VCETISEYIFTLSVRGFDVSTIHLVGHSLGAQCSGLIGRHLKAISGDAIEISKIYALDPAGPGFEFFSFAIPFLTFNSITKSDAKYVQVIHTNGGISGMEYSVGHADFFPNGGTDQSGCELDPISAICNHRRAWFYYQESVRDPQGFPALKCDSYDDFKQSKCDGNEIEFMGFGASGQKSGKFYLRTHSNMFRTALGVDGLNDKSLDASLEDGKHKKVIGFHFEESLTNIFKNITSS